MASTQRKARPGSQRMTRHSRALSVGAKQEPDGEVHRIAPEEVKQLTLRRPQGSLVASAFHRLGGFMRSQAMAVDPVHGSEYQTKPGMTEFWY